MNIFFFIIYQNKDILLWTIWVRDAYLLLFKCKNINVYFVQQITVLRYFHKKQRGGVIVPPLLG